jgi:hypothetical protein
MPVYITAGPSQTLLFQRTRRCPSRLARRRCFTYCPHYLLASLFISSLTAVCSVIDLLSGHLLNPLHTCPPIYLVHVTSESNNDASTRDDTEPTWLHETAILLDPPFYQAQTDKAARIAAHSRHHLYRQPRTPRNTETHGDIPRSGSLVYGKVYHCTYPPRSG